MGIRGRRTIMGIRGDAARESVTHLAASRHPRSVWSDPPAGEKAEKVSLPRCPRKAATAYFWVV
jgi:hypothetical protein